MKVFFSILAMVFIFTSFANLEARPVENESYVGSVAVLERIQTRDTDFFNPYCIVFHVRKDRWHDMKLATGFTMDKLTIERAASVLGDKVYSLVTISYVDKDGNTADDMNFRCLHSQP